MVAVGSGVVVVGNVDDKLVGRCQLLVEWCRWQLLAVGVDGRHRCGCCCNGLSGLCGEEAGGHCSDVLA